MFKLIILAIGFVLGGGTGLWLSATQPELAAKLHKKQEEWIEQGKRQAIEELKTKLDQIVAKQEATPPKSAGTTILGLVSGAQPSGSEQKKEIKQLSAELDKELTALGGPTKK